MFYVLQNESTAARRRVPILLTDAATGTTAQTGVATTTIFPYVAINGNAFIGGTGSLGEAGFGQYYYEFEANEVATLGLSGIHITAAGCRDYDAIAQIAAFDLYSASAGSALSAYDVWSFDYINAPGGVVPVSAAERLEETRTESYAASNNTVSIPTTSDIWNADISGNTDPSAGFNLYQLGIGATGYAAVGLTAGDVWEYDISAISTAGTAGSQLNLAALPSGAGLTAGDVWTYATREITGGIADTVTTLTNRSGFAITGGTITTVSDKTGYSLSSTQTFNLTGDITGNLSGSVNSVTGAVGSVTGNIGGNVVGSVGSVVGNVGGNVAGSVASVTSDVNVSTASMSGIAGTVWSYASREITGGIADTVTTLTNRSGFAITGGTVDTVTNPVDVSTASMAGIANTVWSTLTAPYTTHATFGHQILRSDNAATIGEVTLHQSGGSKRVDADVHAFINNTASATAMLNILTGIGASMTTNITGNITGNLSGSVGSVTNPVDVSTSSMSGIANTVWATDISGYTSPSAGFDLANASSGSGLTAGDVWTYASRTLTSGAGISAYDVWAFIPSSIPLGSYGEILYITSQAANAAESNTNNIGGQVWTYVVGPRTITGGIADTVTTLTNRSGFAITGGTITTVSDKTGYSLSSTQAFDLTGNITGNLSGSVGSVSGAVGSVTSPVTFDSAQYAAIASSVWNAGTRTLTSSGAGLTAGDVWSYATREITGGIADTVTTVSGNVLGSVNSVVTDVPVDEASISADVWTYVTRTLTSGSGISAGDVWTYGSRTITGGIADTVTTLTNRSGFAITGGTVDTVTNGVTVSTNNDKTGYSLSGTQAFNLTGNITGNLSGSVGSVSGNVGGNVNGTVQSIVQDVSLSVGTYGDIAEYVWIEPVRTITGGVATTVGEVTGNILGNVLGNVQGSVNTVTNNVGLSLATYGGIASSVWNAGTRTLTSGGSGISAFDVWNFVLSDANTAEVDLVQAAAGSGLTSGDVWSYASRTITGGIADTVTTLTNRSGFAITGGTVDNVTNGVTVSTNNDKTGYSLSGSQSFNLTGNITGNLSGSVGSVTSGVTVSTNNDKTGYALSGGGVSAVQSGLSTLTQAQVGTEVDASLVDVGLTTTVTGRIDATVSSRLASASYVAPPTEAAIAGTVWGYATRTLTSGAGATAGDVWTYATRSLTSGAGITVNAATNIINGPYFVKSNVDGQDGNLDVIRGMVQDIQLTVTDAFQNPFDVTALGLAVNFYDQAGTLVTSYGTSNLYAPAGLVQFTLDTAVTANEGRYNLILSAAGSGNTIKFGPLQTLVRPF